MSIIHETLEVILAKHGKNQTNLCSSSARQIVSQEIIDSCLGRSKTLLLQEIYELRNQIQDLQNSKVEG